MGDSNSRFVENYRVIIILLQDAAPLQNKSFAKKHILRRTLRNWKADASLSVLHGHRAYSLPLHACWRSSHGVSCIRCLFVCTTHRIKSCFRSSFPLAGDQLLQGFDNVCVLAFLVPFGCGSHLHPVHGWDLHRPTVRQVRIRVSPLERHVVRQPINGSRHGCVCRSPDHRSRFLTYSRPEELSRRSLCDTRCKVLVFL